MRQTTTILTLLLGCLVSVTADHKAAADPQAWQAPSETEFQFTKAHVSARQLDSALTANIRKYLLRDKRVVEVVRNATDYIVVYEDGVEQALGEDSDVMTVREVYLRGCENDGPTTAAQFYSGMIFGTWAIRESYHGDWVTGDWTDDYISLGIGKRFDMASYTSEGPDPHQPRNVDMYLWEWLYVGHDMRFSTDSLWLHSWNGLPQIYFPLVYYTDDPNLPKNHAYMLHIHPDPIFTDRYLGAEYGYWKYEGNVGYLKKRALKIITQDYVRNKYFRYRWRVDVMNLINGLRDFHHRAPSSSLRWQNIELTEEEYHAVQYPNSHEAHRIVMQPQTQVKQDGRLCGWTQVVRDYTWAEFAPIIQTAYPWASVNV